ncbi:MAG: hypothetical protein NWE93_07045 [Candidatus Bathyarchaeota archaeon]|nr:hypothetical protein [Candidatus Bathyarchaeota archaeon]
MSKNWLTHLKINPITSLLLCGNGAIEYFTRRDLLNETVQPITFVWQLPEVQRILRKQKPDGSWPHTGKETVTYPKNHYALVETWKNLRILVEHYQLTKQHESVPKAAEFLLSFQTSQGDIRGMMANQYATYYTGAMLAVLIKAGYTDDPRVEKGLTWLLSMRQNDGGWSIPILTHQYALTQATINKLTSTYAEPIEPDRTKPFSHNWTDMALRAFAAHPAYRRCKEAHAAADLLKTSFFQPDYYTSYQDKRYWVRFLFWWPNLVTALESLALTGYPVDDADVQRGLDWLADNQLPSGLWKLEYGKAARAKMGVSSEQLWLALRIGRIFKRFYP